MSIEYLTAFADFYDVSVEYLLGLSNSRKKEYHDISEQLGLCDKAIDELIQCKENSSSEEGQQLYVSQDTAILNDFLISAEFKRVMEKIKQGLFAYYMYQLSQDGRGSEGFRCVRLLFSGVRSDFTGIHGKRYRHLEYLSA